MTQSAYRISRFNIFSVDPRDGCAVVFNGVTGQLSRLNPRTKMALTSERLALLKPEEREVFRQLGMLVPDFQDELEHLKQRYQRIAATAADAIFVISPCSACNLRCPYCYQQAMTPQTAVMDEATVARTVRFIHGEMVNTARRKAIIKFYGGEPMMAMKRCRAIAEALDRQIRQELGKEVFVWFQSNGTLIDERTFADPIPGMGCVEMTLDGPQRRHDKTRVGRQGKPTFRRICEAAQILADREIPIILRINCESPEELGETLEDLTCYRLDRLPGLSLYDGRVGDCFDDMTSGNFAGDAAIAEEHKAMESSLRVRRLVAGTQWQEKFQRYPLFSRFTGICTFARRDAWCIDPLGDLYECIFQVGVTEFKVGTIGNDGTAHYRTNYETIMNRNPFDNAQCRQCACLPLCWGGCFAKAYKQKGSWDAKFCGSVPELAAQNIAMGLAGGDL